MVSVEKTSQFYVFVEVGRGLHTVQLLSGRPIDHLGLHTAFEDAKWTLICVILFRRTPLQSVRL